MEDISVHIQTEVSVSVRPAKGSMADTVVIGVKSRLCQKPNQRDMTEVVSATIYVPDLSPEVSRDETAMRVLAAAIKERIFDIYRVAFGGVTGLHCTCMTRQDASDPGDDGA